MIDWFGVVTAALWILGLAILLATVSIAYSLSGGVNESVRQVLAQPSFSVATASGIALFALGLFLSVEVGFEKLGWIVVTLLSLWEGIMAWQSWRTLKRRGSNQPPTSDNHSKGRWGSMNSLPLPSAARPRRYWWLTQLGLGILVGVLALGWAVQGLDWKAVLRALTSAQYTWVFVSLCSVLAVALIKTARWGALYVASEPRAPFADLFSALMITQMINIVIPIRIGELIRIGLMKQSGQPGAATLSTIAIEKAVDLVAAGLIAVSVVVLAVAPTWLQNWAGSVLVMGLILVAGLVLVWYLRGWIERVLARALTFSGWLPERWQSRLLRVAHTMLQSFGALTDWAALIRVLLWTMLTWLCSLLAMLTLFIAFDLRLPLAAVAVLMLSTSFSNIVPAPPGLVGIIQAIAVVVLGGYGVPQPIALGFGIVLNVIAVAPLILLGSLGLGQRAVSLMQLLRKSPWGHLWEKPR